MEETESSQAQEAAVQTPAAEVKPGELPEHVKDALMLGHAQLRRAMTARVDRAYKAYRRGSAANFGRFSRTSTEYGDEEADRFWFAGYDGRSWEEAVKEIIQ